MRRSALTTYARCGRKVDASLARSIGEPAGEAEALELLANVALKTEPNGAREALAYLAEAIAIAKRIGLRTLWDRLQSHETFNNPMLDGEANRALFEQQVEIILKAFREESFSHQGKHYTLPADVPYRGYRLKELRLVPRPTHRPVGARQPIVSGSARSLDFMAGHGTKGVISATAESVVQRWLQDYQAAAGGTGARCSSARP